MDEEARDFCRVFVAPSFVQVIYKRSGREPFPPANATFDHQAAMRLNEQPGKANVQQYGRDLYDLLILSDSDPAHRISDAFSRSFADSSNKKQLIVEIADEVLKELPALSWEHLCTPDGLYLAIHQDFRFVRRLSRLGLDRKPPLSRRPRVLVIVSSPQDLETGVEIAGVHHTFDTLEPPFRPEQTEALDTLFGDLKAKGQIADYCILSSSFPNGREENPAYLTGFPTLARIYQELEAAEKENQPYHIVHFLAHGHLDEGSGGYLILTDESGNANAIHQSAFQALFPENHRVRLVFFAACQSAGGEQKIGGPLAGLAPMLLELGIPAVIAMQDKITMGGAAVFTETFYQKLAEGGFVDTAVWEARRGLQRVSQDKEWFIPVLYLQNDNPRLFRPVDSLSARRLVSDLFDMVPYDKFVNRKAELDYYVDLLYEDPNPAICWLWGPKKVGKKTLLEQLRYEAYKRGYGHLMAANRSSVAMVGTGASVLHQLLQDMLEDRQLAQQPEARSCFEQFLGLQDRTYESPLMTIVRDFLDGLEKLAEKLEGGMVCFFYFRDFPTHRNFLLGRAFEELVYKVADRYGQNRLERVRFVIATSTPISTEPVELFPGISSTEFFLEETLPGLSGLDTLKELCQRYGLSKNGQVPRRIWGLVEQQASWSQKQEYLPGPPADELGRLARKLDRLARQHGREVSPDCLGIDWVSPNGVGGEQ